MEVAPLVPARFGDLEELFGPNGAVSGCWCMYWRIPGSSWENRPENRRDFQLRVEAERPAPGLLAYVDGHPVGWVAIAPRTEFPRLLRHRNLRPDPQRLAVTDPGPGHPGKGHPGLGDPGGDDPDDERVWSINCFYIASAHRRRGVAGALVEAAAEHARTGGAQVVEAYPVDRPTAAAGDLYTGTTGLFARAGFTEVGRRHPSRPVMRRRLAR